MRDFYKELREKKVIDAEFIEFLELGQIDLSEDNKKSIIKKIKSREYTFAKGLSEELKERFYSKMPPINQYLEKLTSEGAYKLQAERLLGGEDFNMQEFKEFYEACKTLGYGLEFKDGNSQNNLMQLATFYGRYDAYLFLKNEVGMNPVEYITGDDLSIDGQRYYTSRKLDDGIETFSPFSNDSSEEPNTEFIQERVGGVQEILMDLVKRAEQENGLLARWIGDNYIQYIAAYFELTNVLGLLYKDPNIAVNPVSEKSRGASPVQIFMAGDLRKSAPNFIQMLKELEAQGRVFELDSHSVGFAIINYPEEWGFLISKVPPKDLAGDFIHNFTHMVQIQSSKGVEISELCKYISKILHKHPNILNGFDEKFYIKNKHLLDQENSLLSIFTDTFINSPEKVINNAAANKLFDNILLDKLDETKKAQLLKAAIFHGRADIVDKLIFEHGVNPDGLENTCTDEHGKKRIDSILKKYEYFASSKNDSYEEVHCKASLQIFLQHLESKAAKPFESKAAEPFESKAAEPFEIGTGTEKLKELISLENMKSIDITQFLSEQKYEYQYIAIKKLIEQFAKEYQDVDKEKADQLLGYALNNIDGLGQETKNGILKAAIFQGRADIVDKLIFEHGVNPDDLVVDSDKSKSLKAKVIELANDCKDEDKRRAVKHCLRKYKKIEEEAFKLVTQDLEASYLASAENAPAKPEVASAEIVKDRFKIEDAQIQNAGFGLKVKAFIKFMTSKLNWNGAKISAYFEEKIVPELRAEFEKKPDDVSAYKSEARKYIREQVEAKKKEVMKTISSDSPRR